MNSIKNNGFFVRMLVVFFVTISCVSKAQVPVNPYASVIESQAKKMGNAFIQKDYLNFVKYNHPAVVSKMGGKTKMVAIMEKGVKEMGADNVSFEKITFNSLSEIFKVGSELQCTINQNLTMKVTGGHLTAISTLVAISSDKGKNWFFVDASTKGLSALKVILPNLSSKLKIRKAEKPVFTAD